MLRRVPDTSSWQAGVQHTAALVCGLNTTSDTNNGLLTVGGKEGELEITKQKSTPTTGTAGLLIDLKTIIHFMILASETPLARALLRSQSDIKAVVGQLLAGWLWPSIQVPVACLYTKPHHQVCSTPGQRKIITSPTVP